MRSLKTLKRKAQVMRLFCSTASHSRRPKASKKCRHRNCLRKFKATRAQRRTKSVSKRKNLLRKKMKMTASLSAQT